MSDTRPQSRPTPPLPATTEDLLRQRRTPIERSLNDDVEQIHLQLFETQQYRDFLVPIWREDTVEGSFIADDISAAGLIRQYAKDNNLPIASRAKLQSIVHSLTVVKGRYHLTRKERQNMVNGRTVRMSETDDDYTNNDNYDK